MEKELPHSLLKQHWHADDCSWFQSCRFTSSSSGPTCLNISASALKEDSFPTSFRKVGLYSCLKGELDLFWLGMTLIWSAWRRLCKPGPSRTRAGGRLTRTREALSCWGCLGLSGVRTVGTSKILERRKCMCRLQALSSLRQQLTQDCAVWDL